jgi:hypothetical protein
MRWSSLSVIAGSVAAFVAAFGVAVGCAGATELATAQGVIAISEARAGLRAPSCSDLVVEARDALDDHLIAETRPTTDESGACRYSVSVPAQSAVWLRVTPVLVASVRAGDRVRPNADASNRARPASGSVALRFTVIAPTTYFFAPNEHKTVSLTY